jgi:hypothetical protein
LIKDNQGDEETTRIDSLDIFGTGRYAESASYYSTLTNVSPAFVHSGTSDRSIGEDGAHDSQDTDPLLETNNRNSTSTNTPSDPEGLLAKIGFQRPDSSEMMAIIISCAVVVILSVAAGLTTVFDWVL